MKSNIRRMIHEKLPSPQDLHFLPITFSPFTPKFPDDLLSGIKYESRRLNDIYPLEQNMGLLAQIKKTTVSEPPPNRL